MWYFDEDEDEEENDNQQHISAAVPVEATANIERQQTVSSRQSSYTADIQNVQNKKEAETNVEKNKENQPHHWLSIVEEQHDPPEPGPVTPTEGGPSLAGRFRYVSFAGKNEKVTTDNFKVIDHLRFEELYFISNQVLGHGMTGEVLLGYENSRGNRDRKVAIKTLQLQKAAHLKYFRNEIQVHQGLDHPNIAKLMEVFEVVDKNCVRLVIEFCSGGDLYDNLTKGANENLYTESHVKRLVAQMVQVVKYLHRNCIMHRDLTLTNWVYSGDGSTLKLVDFGCCMKFTSPTELFFDRVGTLYYQAPEMMTDRGYTYKCDLWSLGVIMFIMINGNPPYEYPDQLNPRDIDLERQIIAPEEIDFNTRTWSMVSLECRDFCEKLLKKDARQRELVDDHEWLMRRRSLDHTTIGGATSSSTPISRTKTLDKKTCFSIKQFGASCQLRKAVLSVMADRGHHHFHPRVQHLERLFRQVTTTSEGHYFPANILISSLVQSTGMDQAEAAKVASELSSLSKDSPDQMISFRHFMAAALTGKHILRQKDAMQWFRKFDVDKSGFISRSNLRAVLGGENWGGLSVEQIMKEAGKEERIDVATFVKLVTGNDLVRNPSFSHGLLHKTDDFSDDGSLSDAESSSDIDENDNYIPNSSDEDDHGGPLNKRPKRSPKHNTKRLSDDEIMLGGSSSSSSHYQKPVRLSYEALRQGTSETKYCSADTGFLLRLLLRPRRSHNNSNNTSHKRSLSKSDNNSWDINNSDNDSNTVKNNLEMNMNTVSSAPGGDTTPQNFYFNRLSPKSELMRKMNPHAFLRSEPAQSFLFRGTEENEDTRRNYRAFVKALRYEYSFWRIGKVC